MVLNNFLSYIIFGGQNIIQTILWSNTIQTRNNSSLKVHHPNIPNALFVLKNFLDKQNKTLHLSVSSFSTFHRRYKTLRGSFLYSFIQRLPHTEDDDDSFHLQTMLEGNNISGLSKSFSWLFVTVFSIKVIYGELSFHYFSL